MNLHVRLSMTTMMAVAVSAIDAFGREEGGGMSSEEALLPYKSSTIMSRVRLGTPEQLSVPAMALSSRRKAICLTHVSQIRRIQNGSDSRRRCRNPRRCTGRIWQQGGEAQRHLLGTEGGRPAMALRRLNDRLTPTARSSIPPSFTAR